MDSDIVALAHVLSDLGTRHVFGIPGEGPSLQLLTELEQHGGRFYPVCHEAAAALMAGGYGRAAGIPGVSLSIKGPGFSNMVAGVATNWLDRNPALSLSESYGPGSSPHRMHKRLAHAAMVTPVVKAYADNPAPAFIPDLWNLCLADEPGPVHVDISAHMNGEPAAVATVPASPVTHIPSAIFKKLRAAQCPVVIVGALASRRGWRHKLASLKVPVFTTVAGKGAIDEALPWAGGIFTHSGGPYSPERTILPTADLIVGLGLRTTEILDVKSTDVPMILFDEAPGLGKGLRAVADIVAGEAAFLEVLDAFSDKEWGHDELHAAKCRLKNRLPAERWLPAAVCLLAQELLPPATQFVLDTGSFCTIAEHVLLAHRVGQVMGSPCGRSMGVALPFGVGSAVALPSAPTVVVVGDGGVRMYPETMAIAVRENLPVIVLFMSDGYYSSIRQAAVANGLSQQGLRVNGASWPAFFQAMGCSSERIDSLPVFAAALQSWSGDQGPLLLELAFEPEAYLAMTEGLR